MTIRFASYIAFLAATVVSFAQSDKITRGPYLQMAAPRSMVVRWRTAGTNSTAVYYGMRPEKLDKIAKASGILTEHVVLLEHMMSETKYFYTLGTTNGPLPNAPTNFFITPPNPGDPKPLRVWVIGDAGTQFPQQKQVRDAYYNFSKNRYTDLWLMLGDNAYDSGRDEQYQGAVFDIYQELLGKSVLFPTLGNHDGRSADSKTQSGPYYNIFTLPTLGECGGVMSGTRAYYSYDYGSVHFICLNSCDVDRSPNGLMVQWLKRDLEANKLPWTVAYFHHPPYTKGSHDSDTSSDLVEIRQNLVPVLEQGGVDLVLCGHSHSYERSFLLDGYYGDSKAFNDSYKKAKGDGRQDGDGAYHKSSLRPAPHEGTLYVVAGSSGKTSGGSLNHPAMFYSTNSLGSLVLDFTGTQLDATFLNEKGERLDYFTIFKGSKK